VRLAALLVQGLLLLLIASCARTVDAGDQRLKVPAGFEVTEWARGLSGIRFMAVSPSGVLHAALSNRVVSVQPGNKIQTVVDGLSHASSLAFHEGWIYVGEETRIIRWRPGKRETVVPNLPDGGHWTRTVVIGPDKKMYVSVGSSCNKCIEADKRRAAILQADPDGRNLIVYATGLRNSVGLAFQPGTGELFATENGTDMLGDDTPPEEINVIRKGGFYGWPFCYGDGTPDPDMGNPEKCRNMIRPLIKIQAHSAPLGITFYQGGKFGAEYEGDMFVALHGSWNRSSPVGDKVIRVPMRGGHPGAVQDFVTGWLVNGRYWGRPVGVTVGADGALYVSDDSGGRIWRVARKL